MPLDLPKPKSKTVHMVDGKTLELFDSAVAYNETASKEMLALQTQSVAGTPDFTSVDVGTSEATTVASVFQKAGTPFGSLQLTGKMTLIEGPGDSFVKKMMKEAYQNSEKDYVPSTFKVTSIDTSESVAEINVEQVDEEQTQTAIQGLTEEEMMVEEYIQLYKMLEEFDADAIMKRMGEIKSKLQLIANELVADDSPAIFSSPAGEMEYSKRSKTKVFHDPGALLGDLVEKFGMEAVNKVVKIGAGQLSKLLSGDEMAKFYTEEPGSRSLKEVRPAK